MRRKIGKKKIFKKSEILLRCLTISYTQTDALEIWMDR